ncbi:hypothetical protein [Synechococcus phage BUCT-ZZ01]|nr:hypothetical protein [Synechococcus phage BUCT-ZZ01]
MHNVEEYYSDTLPCQLAINKPETLAFPLIEVSKILKGSSVNLS